MPNRVELAGVRVLVTRPAHQAAGLCELIQQHGGEALRVPALLIRDLSQDLALGHTLDRLADFQLLIFISPNAVQLGLAAINARGGLPEHITLATVGEGSARALRQALGRGPDLVPAEHFDSEGLLALPALQRLAGQKVCILRGEGGRTLLAETLQARGAELTQLRLYRREQAPSPPDLDLTLQNTDIITTTSVEVLECLYGLTPPALRPALLRKPLVVVSERSVAVARELGFDQAVWLAKRAADQAILEVLMEWASKREQRHE